MIYMTSPASDSAPSRDETLRRHIHDIRGHLSPAMLRADSLALSQDERTRRAAQDILTALDAVTRELGIMRRLLARPAP
ncbi:hypothetical protein CFR78_06770 [Komagataeibacter rhaeticus]|nr:hypothetical protein CT154_12275 [Komagataeibacter xylinus]KDU95416.1 hypothetical protein GLUCORHAEAF1_09345 [Komagataeibacter rhaeticus AF1]MBL7239909.1 hypothetical protein [Komagataeibacter rhaeticus]PYD54081.1 hypothetical protein CFR78_06770 [Komagataeibacter rhaeticus]QOC47215.1 hypothetical protein ICJ78_03585 [Komagataeibacter rhaeticus]